MRWHECTLQEIGELARGRSRHRPRYAFHLYGGPYPFIQTREIREAKKYINCYTQTYSEEGLKQSKIWTKGTLCITIAANIAEIGILDFDACFPDSVLGFIPNQDKADLNFIYYTLMHYKRELQYLGEGSVQDNINLGTFENMKFPIPSLPEQRAIAAVLSSLDDKIDLLHRQIATLEAMAEVLFKQWFVENAKEEWKTGCIPDEFEFTMGQSPSGDSFNEVGLGVPMFQGNADFGFRFPSKRVYTTAPTRFAQPFDTLISVRAPVGAQNMAQEKCCIGRGLSAFRYKKNPSFYSYTYFKLRHLLRDILIYNDEGTVFGSISKKDFDDLAITVPDKNAVAGYEKKSAPLNDKIISNCVQIRTLEKLRDALLPKLMSGEVRVSLD